MKVARLSKKAAEDAGKGEGDLDLCPECEWPQVQSFQRGKAPWKFCFNPECVTNEELQKKKKEFKEKLASGEVEIIDGKVVDHTKEKKGKGKKKKVVGKK